jgi:2-oxoglutarate dehydrogenase E1 component
MATDGSGNSNPWQQFYGPNLGYIQEQYEVYSQHPEAVDPEIRDLFARWGPPPQEQRAEPQMAATDRLMSKVVAAERLAQNIRTYGHLAARINPLKPDEQVDTRLLQPESVGLTEADLKALPASIFGDDAPQGARTGWDVIQRLKESYTQSIAFQFVHVHNLEERKWLERMVESHQFQKPLSDDKKKKLLERLIQVEEFERFLHKTFVGQKRFSIEGIDMMVPMLDELIHCSVHGGIGHVLLGMAHRGRLNVLAHILGKPYEIIFSEFHHAPNKELVPSEGSIGINYGWTGDVKYHLGGERNVGEEDSLHAKVTLANNPSHLEFVNPVVEGATRAAQETRNHPGHPVQDMNKAFTVIIHGDAAFPGEGIVPETMNLSRLPGYRTGGTIHLIANNQLGFTTESVDSRSTTYASDLARGFEVPIVHVNADDSEACLAAMRLACDYRARFHKDFLIDLIGYRRFGHNEMDDPAPTQHQLYDRIKKHPTVRTILQQSLISQGILSPEEAASMESAVQEQLKKAYKKMKRLEIGEWDEELLPPEEVASDWPQVETGVQADVLKRVNAELLERPEDFTVYPKLERILSRRHDAFDTEEPRIDWPHAESLAFATILVDGTPIRLTGQDSERGTFAHRHLVLHDAKTGQSFCPMHNLSDAKATFAIHNSPLSEAAVLGFEYGYNVGAPETMVLWEAQFGDFANAGQVIIDQFLAAGRAKWAQKSSLVLLLPHGYEGQGPEHSSARLERFLQLAAENNWTVANLSSAAQYFHLLRRQATFVGKEEARPLVLMTPKSLLRNKRVTASATELEQGSFQRVLDSPTTGSAPERVKRLLLCSGKVAIDLEEALEGAGTVEHVHILRVEQLYPFPEAEIRETIQHFGNLEEIIWVQEEPKNMGAWQYMEPRLSEVAPVGVPVGYIGRRERSSTAEGVPDVHRMEQERIVRESLNLKKEAATNSGGNHRD